MSRNQVRGIASDLLLRLEPPHPEPGNSNRRRKDSETVTLSSIHISKSHEFYFRRKEDSCMSNSKRLEDDYMLQKESDKKNNPRSPKHVHVSVDLRSIKREDSHAPESVYPFIEKMDPGTGLYLSQNNTINLRKGLIFKKRLSKDLKTNHSVGSFDASRAERFNIMKSRVGEENGSGFPSSARPKIPSSLIQAEYNPVVQRNKEGHHQSYDGNHIRRRNEYNYYLTNKRKFIPKQDQNVEKEDQKNPCLAEVDRLAEQEGRLITEDKFAHVFRPNNIISPNSNFSLSIGSFHQQLPLQQRVPIQSKFNQNKKKGNPVSDEISDNNPYHYDRTHINFGRVFEGNQHNVNLNIVETEILKSNEELDFSHKKIVEYRSDLEINNNIYGNELDCSSSKRRREQKVSRRIRVEDACSEEKDISPLIQFSNLVEGDQNLGRTNFLENFSVTELNSERIEDSVDRSQREPGQGNLDFMSSKLTFMPQFSTQSMVFKSPNSVSNMPFTNNNPASLSQKMNMIDRRKENSKHVRRDVLENDRLGNSYYSSITAKYSNLHYDKKNRNTTSNIYSQSNLHNHNPTYKKLLSKRSAHPVSEEERVSNLSVSGAHHLESANFAQNPELFYVKKPLTDIIQILDSISKQKVDEYSEIMSAVKEGRPCYNGDRLLKKREICIGHHNQEEEEVENLDPWLKNSNTVQEDGVSQNRSISPSKVHPSLRNINYNKYNSLTGSKSSRKDSPQHPFSNKKYSSGGMTDEISPSRGKGLKNSELISSNLEEEKDMKLMNFLNIGKKSLSSLSKIKESETVRDHHISMIDLESNRTKRNKEEIYIGMQQQNTRKRDIAQSQKNEGEEISIIDERERGTSEKKKQDDSYEMRSDSNNKRKDHKEGKGLSWPKKFNLSSIENIKLSLASKDVNQKRLFGKKTTNLLGKSTIVNSLLSGRSKSKKIGNFSILKIDISTIKSHRSRDTTEDFIQGFNSFRSQNSGKKDRTNRSQKLFEKVSNSYKKELGGTSKIKTSNRSPFRAESIEKKDGTKSSAKPSPLDELHKKIFSITYNQKGAVDDSGRKPRLAKISLEEKKSNISVAKKRIDVSEFQRERRTSPSIDLLSRRGGAQMEIEEEVDLSLMPAELVTPPIDEKKYIKGYSKIVKNIGNEVIAETDEDAISDTTKKQASNVEELVSRRLSKGESPLRRNPITTSCNQNRIDGGLRNSESNRLKISSANSNMNSPNNQNSILISPDFVLRKSTGSTKTLLKQEAVPAWTPQNQSVDQSEQLTPKNDSKKKVKVMKKIITDFDHCAGAGIITINEGQQLTPRSNRISNISFKLGSPYL